MLHIVARRDLPRTPLPRSRVNRPVMLLGTRLLSLVATNITQLRDVTIVTTTYTVPAIGGATDLPPHEEGGPEWERRPSCLRRGSWRWWWAGGGAGGGGGVGG